MLLDLSMPKRTASKSSPGCAQPVLKRTAIVILSASERVERARIRLGATPFL
jgi:hypothetical protein